MSVFEHTFISLNYDETYLGLQLTHQHPNQRKSLEVNPSSIVLERHQHDTTQTLTLLVILMQYFQKSVDFAERKISFPGRRVLG